MRDYLILFGAPIIFFVGFLLIALVKNLLAYHEFNPNAEEYELKASIFLSLGIFLFCALAFFFKYGTNNQNPRLFYICAVIIVLFAFALGIYIENLKGKIKEQERIIEKLSSDIERYKSL